MPMNARATTPSDRLDQLNADAARCFEQDDPDGAVRIAAEATALAREAFGEASIELAKALHSEGYLLHVLCRPDLAAPLYAEMVPLHVQHGLEFSEVTEDLEQLMRWMQEGEYQEGALLVMNQLADVHRHAGPAHQDGYLEWKCALAGVFQRAGAHETVSKILASAVEGCEELRGANDVSLARLLNSLGVARKQAGDFEGATAAYIRAHGITEGQPEAAADRATAANNLGMLYSLHGRLDEAERYLAEAVGWRRQHLGQADQNTQASLFALTEVRAALGHLEEAADSFRAFAGDRGGDGNLAREADRLAARFHAEGDSQAAGAFKRLGEFLAPPGSVRYREALGLYRNGDVSGAIGSVRRALAEMDSAGPDFLDARRCLAEWVVEAALGGS